MSSLLLLLLLGVGGEGLPDADRLPLPGAGGLKCPVCSFVYGTRWEFNRHLKSKHGLKLVETEGEPKWEVRLPRAGPATFLRGWVPGRGAGEPGPMQDARPVSWPRGPGEAVPGAPPPGWARGRAGTGNPMLSRACPSLACAFPARLAPGHFVRSLSFCSPLLLTVTGRVFLGLRIPSRKRSYSRLVHVKTLLVSVTVAPSSLTSPDFVRMCFPRSLC